MRMIKMVFIQITWLALSIAIAMLMFYIVIGGFIEPTNALARFLDGFSGLVTIIIGSACGLIAYLLFLPVRSKILNKTDRREGNFFASFAVLIALNFLVRVVHHVLEFTLNWI